MVVEGIKLFINGVNMENCKILTQFFQFITVVAIFANNHQVIVAFKPEQLLIPIKVQSDIHFEKKCLIRQKC